MPRTNEQPQQQLYVVHDSQGSGRLVGIFDDRKLAEEVLAVHPPYYALSECTLNAVNPRAVEWLPSDQLRARLAEVAKRGARR